MHLIQAYALATSSKISKPFILDKYFPIKEDKYITIHTTSKESKTYHFWQEVVNILHPYLKEHNISIVQIGSGNEEPLQNTVSYLGQTSINQVAYIVKNGIAHLGVDSFPVHIASSYGKKILALYSNNFINNVRPFFSKQEDVVLLEPNREINNKPSFTLSGDSSINKIKPEDIAEKFLNLIGITYKKEFETLYIGRFFNTKMVHSIPNQIVNPSELGLNSLIIRMDINFNEAVLAAQLEVCPCSILTNKPININLIKKYKNRILEIVYFIDKNNRREFVKEIHNLHIPYKLISELSQDELNAIKLDYIDFNIIIPKDTSPIAELENIEDGKVFYKTNQFYLSNKKIYQSEYAYHTDSPIPNFKHILQPIKNDNIQYLIKDKDFLYFFKKVVD